MTKDASRPSVDKSRAVLGLLFNALVWGCAWWPLRYLEAAGVHALWFTTVFSGLAVLWLLSSRQFEMAKTWRNPYLWVLLIAAGLTNIFFNWGISIGDVMRVVLLFYLMPAWVVVLAHVVLHERITWFAVLQVVMSLLGMVLILKRPGEWPLPRDLGDALGLAGGLTFAVTNVMLRRLKQVDSNNRMLAMFAGGFAMSGLTVTVGVGAGTVAFLPMAYGAWIWVLLGFSALVIAGNITLQYGATRLLSRQTSLIMLTEIIFAGLSAAALGAAQLNWQLGVGALFIIAASVLSIIWSQDQ